MTESEQHAAPTEAAAREELQRAIGLLGADTRPGRLLRFMGEKYFGGKAAQLTEYTIASEVFGRSPQTFDSGEDAVVRVETHRLRKKLRDLYANSPGPQGLRVSLPAGTYVPRIATGMDAPATATDTHDTPPAPRKLPLPVIVAAVVLAAGVGLFFFLRPEPRAVQTTVAPSAPVGEAPAAASTDLSREVRIMAGYSGSEVIDNSGNRWKPDRYFVGGASWPRTDGFIRRTSRPFLFANWRNGEFSYDIPLPPGSYELRMFFISHQRVGDEKLAGFNIALGGQPLLTAFDVNFDALGSDVADEKVFRDIQPDKDGFVRLHFTNQVGSPSLNALEILPGIPGKMHPIRIIAQPTSYVDKKGQRWRADDYYSNGFQSNERRAVQGTDDPELFGAERFGHFSYAIPVDTRGRYSVVLHFTEFYFGPQLEGKGGVGSRVFNVYCNGQFLLQDFDVFKEAGSRHVLTKTFRHIKPSAQGKINLTFEPIVNNATISGIEIIDESGE